MKTNSRGVEESKSCVVAGPIEEIGPDGDAVSLLDLRLSTSRLEFDGTKRECL
jgi:hypothetical protein